MLTWWNHDGNVYWKLFYSSNTIQGFTYYKANIKRLFASLRLFIDFQINCFEMFLNVIMWKLASKYDSNFHYVITVPGATRLSNCPPDKKYCSTDRNNRWSKWRHSVFVAIENRRFCGTGHICILCPHWQYSLKSKVIIFNTLLVSSRYYVYFLWIH